MDYQALKSLIIKNRSYRRFYEEETIGRELLIDWVDSARLSASARNLQTLKYKIITEEKRADIFPLLSWAGYLRDWKGPEAGERPNAYILLLNDNRLSENYFCDDGIASQSILLSAVASGYGGCIIAACNKPKLREVLRLSDDFSIIHVIALGKPKEEVKIETAITGEIKYWRDEQQVHHVPKRPLDEIVLMD